MVDFLKAQPDRKYNSQILECLGQWDRRETNSKTGELEFYWNRGCWTFHQNSSGYLKFHANVPQAYSGLKGYQLKYSELKKTLWDFGQRFNVPLSKSIIKNVEFNIDVQIDIYCKDVLNWIYAYRNTSRHRFSNKAGTGRYIEFLSGDSSLKIYDREKIHRGAYGNILRVENKFRDNEAIKSGHQNTVFDLMDRDFLSQQSQNIVKRVNQLVIVEPIDPTKLPVGMVKTHNEFSTIHSLNQLLKPRKDRYTKHRKLKKLKEINQKWGQDLQGNLIAKLEKQAEIILNS